MRGGVALVLLGLAMLPGCARDNPLFGAGAETTGSVEGKQTAADPGTSRETGANADDGAASTTNNAIDDTSAGATSDAASDDGTTSRPWTGDTMAGGSDSSSETIGDGAEPPVVVLFEGPTLAGDFLSGQVTTTAYAAATEVCIEAAVAAVPCSGGGPVFAVLRADPISVFTVDSLPGALADLAVVGPTGVEVADSVEALLTGELSSTLADALVVDKEFWTGGFTDSMGGDVDCDDWQGDAGFGLVGRADVANAVWFEASDRECGASNPIVCGCVQ